MALMSDAPTCPICTMPELLESADGFECATCGHEWMADADDGLGDIRDANGNLLANGDNVSVVKDVKLNGKAGGVKAGTKIKSIRLVSGDHEVDAKIDGRPILIRAQFVKKV
jgi:protein PhnA